MLNIRKVSVRDLQHNLSVFLEIAKNKPLLVTKHGRDEILLINPDQFKVVKVRTKIKKAMNIMSSPFIGLYKERRLWKSKTSYEIANELRRKAWYGR